MEHKRRNSILKKPPPIDDETTGDVTTKIKRRISFSGKKSVKEFIAGEEEATIWGTSYEESADGLLANSIERSLVNVNEKRIVLRSRRVVVDLKTEPKRRSRKKVSVAENDKENVFVHLSQLEAKSLAQVGETIAKVESPVKSEMALVKSHFEDAKTQTMSDSIDRVNVCSSTFDFINYSGVINKSITIEHSVDVTLNENELQMYKFRIPVTAMDISPTWSLSSLSDGSSPNISSRSILISETEANMLNMLRGKKDPMSLVPQIKEIQMKQTGEIEVKPATEVLNLEEEMDMSLAGIQDHIEAKCVPQCEVPNVIALDMNVEEISEDKDQTNRSEGDGKKRTTMHMNQTMNLSRCEVQETKNLKRKTITKVKNMEESSFILESTMSGYPSTSILDINSPLRKKPMHNVSTKAMDITVLPLIVNSQNEPIRRQTIHFESADVEESLIGCPDEKVASLSQVSGQQRESIYAPTDMIQDSPKPTKQLQSKPKLRHYYVDRSVDSRKMLPPLEAIAPKVDAKQRESIYAPTDMIEDSPKPTKQPPQAVAPKVVAKQRESIYAPTDMIEDSPKPTKQPPQAVAPKVVAQQRESIYAPTDMIEDSPKPTKQPPQAVAPKVVAQQRESIYAPTDMIEDSPKPTKQPPQAVAPKVVAQQHESIYASADMIEDSPKPTKQAQSKPKITHYNADRSVDSRKMLPPTESAAPKVGAKQRESIYTPSDMIADSPKPTKQPHQAAAPKVVSKRRESIYAPTDMIEDSLKPTKQPPQAVAPKVVSKQRESIYAPTDMIEDSPKPTKQPHQAAAPKVVSKQRESIYAPTDMIEDSPKPTKQPPQAAAPKVVAQQRESIYASADMIEDSPKPTKQPQSKPKLTHYNADRSVDSRKMLPPPESAAPKVGAKQRELIYTPSDMIADSPKPTKQPPQAVAPKAVAKQRKSIYAPTDMIEDSSKPTKQLQSKRKLTHYNADRSEDSRKMLPPTGSATPKVVTKQRESIYTSTDMIEDSPKPVKQPQTKPRLTHYLAGSTVDSLRTLSSPEVAAPKDSMELERKTLPLPEAIAFKLSAKQRESIYTPTDMIEDSPKLPKQLPTKPKLTHYLAGSTVDSRETLPPPEAIAPKVIAKQRESIYAPTDMIEDSPKPTKQPQSKPNLTHYNADRSVDSRKMLPPTESAAPKVSAKQRESIYTPTDMIEDSPKPTKPKITHYHADKTVDYQKTVVPLGDVAKVCTELERKTLPTYQQKTNFTPVDIVENSPKAGKEVPSHQTVYFPADIIEDVPLQPMQVEHSVAKVKTCESNYTPADMQAIHFNNDLEVNDDGITKEKIVPNTFTTAKRQTIHFNQDLEVDDINDQQENSRCTVEDHSTKVTKRFTRHLHDDIELENEDARQMAIYNETKRNTEENGFTNTRNEELTFVSKLKKRQTIHFQENNDLEESVHIPQNEENYKALPQPKRVTIYSDQHIDIDESPQKVTACKSSFSRTLHFDEIRTNNKSCLDMDMTIQELATGKTIVSSPKTLVEEDSPLYYTNAKSKSAEITSEIDRSLAEYLKAEAAATLFPRNSQEISMHVVESEPDEVFEDQESKSRRKTSHEPENIFEESGMQLLQNPTSRGKTNIPSKDMLEEFDRGAKRSQFIWQPPDMVKEPQINDVPLHCSYRQISDISESRSMTNTEAMDIMEANHVSLQPNRCSLRQCVQTAPMMEECENSMEISILSDEPIKSVSRKTIHFANENAVDESFFDENQSKPATSQNSKSHRHTLFFDETKNPMEVTLSPTKTNEVQIMKEILNQNYLLFTQSKLLEAPTYENRTSVISFSGKNNSMDVTTENECESPGGNVNQECTPTKAKLSKSRIPQLIDSAKKLQSIKRSMKFIQEELPNLSCPVQRAATPEERKIPDETLDTMEIPHIEIHGQMQESFKTVDIPRRVTEHVPKHLQESFDTVEIPRRATTFQRNDTLHLCPSNEMETTNVSQKSFFRFEDAPITISDVSTFFAQKQLPLTCKQTSVTYSPNTTEALCNLDVNRFAVDNNSSDSEDTEHKLDKFKKRYVELTCDSIVSQGMREEIEKTYLSLVDTLDEETEVVENECPPRPPHLSPVDTVDEENEVVENECLPPPPPPPPERIKTNSSVCRNCKRNRLSLTQNDTTIGSFLLEPLPEYKMDLAALQELATKPKISDVAQVWQQKMRESDSFNTTDGSRTTTALDDGDSVDDFIEAVQNGTLIPRIQKPLKEFKRQISFVDTIWRRVKSEKSNWILNELLLFGNVLKFTHTRIRTFAICISFTPKDPRGIEVNFNEIQLVTNVLHTRQWTPFDYALHYQLLVELPFDLRKLCPTSENLFQLLEHVEEVTQDVLKTGKNMLNVILTSPATLIREPSGRLYIHKIARMKSPQNDVKCTEFQIEVRNIKKLSYECIAVPPLYEFDEKIQLLPLGPNFLRVFLADPLQYMKT